MNGLPPDHGARMARARLSLEGLSVGDAFGDQFFANPDVVEGLIEARALPRPPWLWTDDTQMTLSVVEQLARHGGIVPDELARAFAARYERKRGYGPAMHRLLAEIADGVPWQEAARKPFEGQGSHGNGAAMRVAPIGAYFAGEPEEAARQAALSAAVTHAHPEGIAGAVAVAVAASVAAALSGLLPSRRDFLDAVLPHVPGGIVRERLRHTRDLSEGASVRLAVSALGNGTGVSATDTVPFALWCAGESLGNYEEALWLTVSGLGDRDTTCAIVGGIVVLTATEPGTGVPAEWRDASEPLPPDCAG